METHFCVWAGTGVYSHLCTIVGTLWPGACSLLSMALRVLDLFLLWSSKLKEEPLLPDLLSWPITTTGWFKPHMWNGCDVCTSELRHKACLFLTMLMLGVVPSLIHLALNAHITLNTWMPKQVCLDPVFLLIIFLWLQNSKTNFIFIKPCTCLMRVLPWKLSPSTGTLGIQRV